MKKKIISLCLVVALGATAVIGGTLAYFTDVDQNTNEFGVAGLKIDLYEKVMHVDGADKVKEFGDMTFSGENAKYFYETDGVLTLGKGDDTNPNFHYKDIMPGDKMTKIVTVENKEEYAAYVALAIQNPNYNDKINPNIDGYYEGKGYDAAAMQGVTDDVWSGDGWKLSYDKTTNGFGIRYYPTHATPVDQDGSENYVGETDVKLIAIDYTVWQTADYNVGYKDNMMGKDGYQDGEDYARMWVYYLYLPAGESYTLDLTTTCPTYFTQENIAAFENMQIDVQAAAIQVDGFATAKDAFTELNKTYGFGF